MNKTFLVVIGVIILAGAGYFVWQSGVFGTVSVEPVAIPEGIILFYGDTCPHCKNVEEFMVQNDVLNKVQITQLEVYNNKDNQNILAQVATKCNIETSQIGVPFLWTGEDCIVGDEPIIDYFKNAANIE